MGKISQGYKAVSDPALNSERRIANCESLEINNYCTDIACYLEYTIVPKGVYSVVAYWTAKLGAFDGLGAYHLPKDLLVHLPCLRFQKHTKPTFLTDSFIYTFAEVV